MVLLINGVDFAEEDAEEKGALIHYTLVKNDRGFSHSISSMMISESEHEEHAGELEKLIATKLINDLKGIAQNEVKNNHK